MPVHCYISSNTPPWLDITIVKHAIKNIIGVSYLDFITRDINRDEWKPALHLSESGALIFNDDILKNSSKTASDTQDKIKLLSPEEVISIVQHHLKLTSLDLYSTGRNRTLSRKRAVVIKYLLEYSETSMSQVSRLFQRTQGTLTRQVLHVSQHMNKYFPKELLARIENDIITKLK